MNGAESLLHTAAAAGVRVCFSNPGTTEMPLVAALDRVSEIRSVLGLFEGVCTGAADGYGRMTGTPALTLLHLGPGFANGIANLHNARRARSPIVNLIGDQATWHLAYDAPLTSDIVSLAQPVSKWVKTATSAKQVADDVNEAIRAATAAPSGVSSLILPVDCQWDPGDEAPPHASAESQDTRSSVSSDRVDHIAKRLRGGGPSALLLGGDALGADAQRAARRIASAVDCKVWVETFPARWERAGDVPAFERFPYFPEQGLAALEACDCVVAAGARTPVSFFGYPGVPSQLVPDEKAVVLCDETQDAEQALCALADALGAAPSTAATTPAAAPPAPIAPTGSEPLDPAITGAILAAHLPEGAIVIDEAATSGLPFYASSAGGPRHTLLSLTGGAIGQGLPCATGAAIACPDRPVIAFQADGSALYTSQALWTQAREGLHVITLLCSNRAYRILQIELARAGVAEAGPKARALTSLSDPAIDWVALATGYGVPAVRASDAAELGTALRRALAESGPSLIELALD